MLVPQARVHRHTRRPDATGRHVIQSEELCIWATKSKRFELLLSAMPGLRRWLCVFRRAGGCCVLLLQG